MFRKHHPRADATAPPTVPVTVRGNATRPVPNHHHDMAGSGTDRGRSGSGHSGVDEFVETDTADVTHAVDRGLHHLRTFVDERHDDRVPRVVYRTGDPLPRRQRADHGGHRSRRPRDEIIHNGR